MAKKPVSLSRVQRTIALVKRNPRKSITFAMAVLAGIPGSVAGANYIGSATEPGWIAQRYWVRNELQPLKLAQADHDYAINYLIQQQTLKALNDAKADMQRSPNTTTQNVIEKLQRSVQKRQELLDKGHK